MYVSSLVFLRASYLKFYKLHSPVIGLALCSSIWFSWLRFTLAIGLHPAGINAKFCCKCLFYCRSSFLRKGKVGLIITVTIGMADNFYFYRRVFFEHGCYLFQRSERTC